MIDEIIEEYDMLPNQYPRFFVAYRKIISFSKEIREELIKQGINRLLRKSSAGESEDDDSE